MLFTMHENGASYSQISESTGVPRTSVSGIVSRMRANGGSALSAPRLGRPRKTDARVDRKIVRQVLDNRRMSAERLAETIKEDLGVSVSPSTVRNRLRDQDYHGRAARKRAYLTKAHMKKRKAYAQEMLRLLGHDWSNVMFCDEARVELDGTSGRVWVWRKKGEAFLAMTVRL
jgi:transposase